MRPESAGSWKKIMNMKQWHAGNHRYAAQIDSKLPKQTISTPSWAKLRLHRGSVNVTAERGGESPNSPSLYGHYAGRDRNHVTVAAGNKSSSHDDGMGIGEEGNDWCVMTLLSCPVWGGRSAGSAVSGRELWSVESCQRIHFEWFK